MVQSSRSSPQILPPAQVESIFIASIAGLADDEVGQAAQGTCLNTPGSKEHSEVADAWIGQLRGLSQDVPSR